MRCTLIHTCPAWLYAPPIRRLIKASLISVSGSIMTAALPPSSKTTFLRPARAFISQPTASEPVKLSNLKRSSVTSRSASSRGQGNTEKAPCGKSVSARISAIFKAEIGVRLGGFSTKGQPAAIAGAILCAVRFKGKLNGLIKDTAPIGTCFTMPR